MELPGDAVNSNCDVDKLLEITPAMIQAGAEILCLFDSQYSSREEYAEKVYRAMVEVSDSEP